MATIHYGNHITENAATYTNETNGSGTTIRHFEGDAAQIQAMAETLRNQGYSIEMVEGPAWTLTATIATTVEWIQFPPDQWSIEPNAGAQDVLESNIELVRYLSTTTKELIRKAIKNPGQNIPLFATGSSADERVAATRIYSDMVTGADSIRQNTLTVKRTITVPPNYQTHWTNLGLVNTVLSLRQLISTTTMPNYVSVLLPPSVTGDKTLVTANGQTFYVYSNWGYFQEHPSYQIVADNKIEISQTWHYNKWLNDYYVYLE